MLVSGCTKKYVIETNSKVTEVNLKVNMSYQSWKYAYDSRGLLTQNVSPANAATMRSYEYNGAQVKEIYSDWLPGRTVTIQFHVGSNGYADVGSYIDMNTSDLSSNYKKQEYAYTNGYLTFMKETDFMADSTAPDTGFFHLHNIYIKIERRTYVNGNCVSILDSTFHGFFPILDSLSDVQQIIFEYNSIVNNQNIDFSVNNLSPAFYVTEYNTPLFGKSNKNLIIKRTLINNSYVQLSSSFQYQINLYNNIYECTQTDPYSTYTYTFKYEYSR